MLPALPDRIDEHPFNIALSRRVNSPIMVGDHSERHIQLSIVEHDGQLKTLPVSLASRFYPQQPDLAVQRLGINV